MILFFLGVFLLESCTSFSFLSEGKKREFLSWKLRTIEIAQPIIAGDTIVHTFRLIGVREGEKKGEYSITMEALKNNLGVLCMTAQSKVRGFEISVVPPRVTEGFDTSKVYPWSFGFGVNEKSPKTIFRFLNEEDKRNGLKSTITFYK